jgi:hypothetical protein
MCAPPVSYSATPCASYYAPATAVTPCVTYYSPPVAPVAAPYGVYYGVAGTSIYGTPKVYVPDQPVRNAPRAVTP